mgnify:FL=1
MTAATAGQWLAQCFDILGGGQSKTGRAWREGSRNDRRLLLMLSGRTGAGLSKAVDNDWEQLPPAVRAQVVAGLKRFKRWADEVCQE